MKEAAPTPPTIADIRTWPATVDVTATATALGVSRSHLYEQIKAGQSPIKVVKLGTRVRVVTSSILALLDPDRVAA